MAITSKKAVYIIFLFVVIIVCSLYPNIVIETYAIKDELVQFYPKKNYNGVPFEVELYKKKYAIPEEYRGKVRSVSIPQMYALHVYNNDSFKGTPAKLMGNVHDIDVVLQKTPGWTGSIVGVKVVGEYIQIYEKPEFKGRQLSLLSSMGPVVLEGGPPKGKQVKSYKREDVLSFRIPQGLIVVVTTIAEDGSTEQKQYSGGDYPRTAIQDILGTRIIILKEPIP